MRVAAVDQNVVGPTNTPAVTTALTPAWHYLVASQTLEATWAAGQPDAYLRVYRTGETAPAQTALGTGSSATFPAPVASYPEGPGVTLNGRGLSQAPWA